jgi:PAS domain S-box-containing protein
VPPAEQPIRPSPDPLLSGEFAGEVVRALRVTLLTLLVVLPLLLVAALQTPTTRLGEAISLGALIPATVLLYLWLRAGRVKWSFYGVVILLIAYGVAGTAMYGSIRSASVLSFVAAIVVGGIFLQSRALIAAVSASIVALGLLVHAEQAGWLPQPNYSVNAVHWIVHSLVLGAIALNIYYARGLVLRATARVEQQRDQRERAEVARNETESLFRSLFQNSPAALMITVRPSGKVQDINEAFERMFLITRDEAVDHTTGELGLWESSTDREAYLAELDREGRCLDLRKRFRRRNGEPFDAVISSESLLWRGSTHLFSAITDVSAEAQARDALRASEQRLEAIFRQGPTPIIVTDIERQQVVDMNVAAEQLIGLSSEQARNSSGPSLFVDGQQQAAIRQQLLAGGAISSLPARVRNLTTDSIAHVLVSASLVEENGRRYAIYSGVDVTAEVLAREALRLSEERFSAAFHFSPIGMTITRLDDGTLLEVNAADERTLGYTRAETLGRRTLDNGAWTSPQARQQFVERLGRDGRVLGQEVQMRDKHGALVEALVFAQRIELDGEPCILAATLNVTEQRRQAAEIQALNENLERRVRERTSQLEAANAELEAFTYTVSHDLRSPLRAIDGFTRLLETGLADRLSPDERSLFTRILDNGRNMNRLIDDLLNLSRLGQVQIRRAPVDVSAIARDIAQRLSDQEPARVVRWEIAPGLMAECDAGLLRIVLENLLGNAWKFTGRQALARIRLGREPMPHGGHCWYVADDGAGFDMRHAARLFAPFQRMHSAEEFAGTGIGLATVQRIVGRHGGRVWAESEPGKGATFRFTLESGADEPEADAAGARALAD